MSQPRPALRLVGHVCADHLLSAAGEILCWQGPNSVPNCIHRSAITLAADAHGTQAPRS